jgi:glycosyltransferase involved in cell wall biosynthesis
MMAVAYNAADVVAIPSEEDNLPNVGIEALCCGTPVVGFNIGGIPDMVQHGQNGLLTTAISGEALSASIQSALFQRELLLPKAEIAAEAATKFSWEKQAKGFMEVFNNIAKS